jgi:hypothetical protein
MKTFSRINKKLLILICVPAAVAACGGGENEEGALAPLEVTPAEITLTWPQDPAAPQGTPPACGASFAGRPFVNGGAAPYTIQNTDPLFLAIRNASGNPISRVDAGGSFDVYSLGGCFESLSINIVDALGRRVVVSVTSQPAGATATP